MEEETKQKLLKAGKVAAQVRREGAAKLKVPGTSVLEVMDYCEKRILELGVEIAWAQFGINDVAAHDCPAESDETVTKEGDLIKIDIGTHIDGYIADNAMTVEVGDSHQHDDLIKASQDALRAAIEKVKPGCQLWELGAAQMSAAEKLGLTTITNLSGHNLKQYKVHANVSIPTYNSENKMELEEGWQIAIEPFVTAGQGIVKEKGKATVFMVSKNGSARTPYARKILEEVKDRKGLPFTTRWLTRKLGRGAVVLGLRELQQSGVVRAYPPLAEVTGQPVAQFEHSMIVTEEGALVYTRHEDDEW
jgi:methionyl aminopeptidase